jgi:hypothetical protein
MLFAVLRCSKEALSDGGAVLLDFSASRIMRNLNFLSL